MVTKNLTLLFGIYVYSDLDSPGLFPIKMKCKPYPIEVKIVGYDETNGCFKLEANGTPFTDLPLQVLFDLTPGPRNIRSGYVTLNGIRINDDNEPDVGEKGFFKWSC